MRDDSPAFASRGFELWVSIVLCFVSLWISLAIYVIVPLIYILPGRIDRHWSAQPRQARRKHRCDHPVEDSCSRSTCPVERTAAPS
jgi:hypothetical protein